MLCLSFVCAKTFVDVQSRHQSEYSGQFKTYADKVAELEAINEELVKRLKTASAEALDQEVRSQ